MKAIKVNKLEPYCIIVANTSIELNCYCESEELAKRITAEIIGVDVSYCYDTSGFEPVFDHLQVVSHGKRGFLNTKAVGYKSPIGMGMPALSDILASPFVPYYLRSEKIDQFLDLNDDASLPIL